MANSTKHATGMHACTQCTRARMHAMHACTHAHRIACGLPLSKRGQPSRDRFLNCEPHAHAHACLRFKCVRSCEFMHGIARVCTHTLARAHVQIHVHTYRGRDDRQASPTRLTTRLSDSLVLGKQVSEQANRTGPSGMLAGHTVPLHAPHQFLHSNVPVHQTRLHPSQTED